MGLGANTFWAFLHNPEESKVVFALFGGPVWDILGASWASLKLSWEDIGLLYVILAVLFLGTILQLTSALPSRNPTLCLLFVIALRPQSRRYRDYMTLIRVHDPCFRAFLKLLYVMARPY